MEYANNPENFAVLDEFTEEKGLDFGSFLASLERKRLRKQCVLITPPTSPPSSHSSSGGAPPTPRNPVPTTPIRRAQAPPPSHPRYSVQYMTASHHVPTFGLIIPILVDHSVRATFTSNVLL